MKKYVVEIVEKVVYKVERSAVSPECAENLVRELYDMGAFEDEGELKSVTFDSKSTEVSDFNDKLFANIESDNHGVALFFHYKEN